MAFAELRMRRARIKAIADEIDRFPTTGLVQKLREEAQAGIRCDPKCALGFFAVGEIGANLLTEGAWATTTHLSAAVHALDDIVAVRLLQHHKEVPLGAATAGSVVPTNSYWAG